ncbi:hypothetical protein HY612_05020 [Candidatus Roizmanbacteria bacterium]|nr:hypothetical protein [Candidatus Roizmanbacteria bacterium]
MKKANKTWGIFLSILKVERVVALNFDCVFLFITIDARFENTTCKEDRKSNDSPPKNNPKYGETINDIPTNPPTIIKDLFSSKYFNIRVVSYEAKDEIT